jgi:hypothetical protein
VLRGEWRWGGGLTGCEPPLLLLSHLTSLLSLVLSPPLLPLLLLLLGFCDTKPISQSGLALVWGYSRAWGGGTAWHGGVTWRVRCCLSTFRLIQWGCRLLGLLAEVGGGGGSHHSVQISDSNIDNMKTLYRLRRLSGRPLDYTLYTMKTGQPDNIQCTRQTYLPNQHLILHSNAIRFSGLPFYKQIQWIQYGGKQSIPLPFVF